MSVLWDRIDYSSGAAVVRSRNVPVHVVLNRLEQGEPLADIAREAMLDPLDLIAALAVPALGQEGRDAPPLVQDEPRNPRLLHALKDEAWKDLFPHASRPARLALAAGLLQIHDFWDESHHAAQTADDLGEPLFSAYWHAIAHRREPDPGNAAYWFRRVGRHPIHAQLARLAARQLDAFGDPRLQSQLIKAGEWNSFAFIDFTGATKAGSTAETLARDLQRLEMVVLLEATAAGL